MRRGSSKVRTACTSDGRATVSLASHYRDTITAIITVTITIIVIKFNGRKINYDNDNLFRVY